MRIDEINNLINNVQIDAQLQKKVKDYGVGAKICKTAFFVFICLSVVLLIIFFVVARQDLSSERYNPFRIVICVNFAIALVFLAINYYLSFEKLRLIDKAFKEREKSAKSDADEKQ